MMYDTDYDGLTNTQAELAALLDSDAGQMARVTTEMNGREHVRAVCDRGACWKGVSHPVRVGTEGYRLAERDAEQHGRAHVTGSGWFDYERGWVTGR